MFLSHRARNALTICHATALAVVFAGLAGCAVTRPPASTATLESHLAAARTAAGSDLGNLMGLCNPVPATRPTQEQSDRSIAALMGQPAPPPGLAFDNLVYVGAKWVSAWAIKTSDGIILIDALNNAAEAAQLIEPGLRQFGLDPAQIKYIVATHGHGDHYGGAVYLVERYQPRVVMSAVDWKMTEGQLEFSTPLWGAPPKRDPARDLAVQDGDRITLGDTTVTFYLTPGHTKGTITPVFEVRSGGKTYRAMIWGGTAFNFGRDIPRLDSYIEATARMRRVAEQLNIDVLLSNHAGYDGALPKLERLRAEPGLQPNPFVLGTPTVMRALAVMGECAQATRDRFEMAP